MIGKDFQENLYRSFVFFVLVLMTNLAMIASTAVVIITPVLAGAMALSTNLTMWISTAYLMVIASTVPCSMYLAKKYGYKETFLGGAFIYIVFSSLIGFTESFYPFLIFRILSGLGAGLFFPVSLSIISNTFSSQMVGIALAGYTALGFGLGAALGFTLGGVIAQYYSWTWIFFLNAVIGTPFIILSFLVFKRSEIVKESGQFDLKGYGLFIVLACSFIMILTNAKADWNTEGWNSLWIQGFMGLGGSAFVLFILEEKKSQNPLFYLGLFRIQSFTFGCILLFLIGGLFFSTASLFPLTLIEQLHYSKIQSAQHMIVYGVSFGFFGGLAGLFLTKIGLKKLIVFGGAIIVLDTFIQHSFTIYSDHFYILLLLVLRGAGIGLTMGPVTAWALKDVPTEWKGNASIVVTIFRQLGAGLIGALIKLIAYDRYYFHIQMFAEAFELGRATLKRQASRLTLDTLDQFGVSIEKSKALTQDQIFFILQRQAQILSFNDAFFLLGIVFSIVLSVILLVILFEFFKQNRAKPINLFDNKSTERL